MYFLKKNLASVHTIKEKILMCFFFKILHLFIIAVKEKKSRRVMADGTSQRGGRGLLGGFS
jgi:hypothetical protein